MIYIEERDKYVFKFIKMDKGKSNCSVLAWIRPNGEDQPDIHRLSWIIYTVRKTWANILFIPLWNESESLMRICLKFIKYEKMICFEAKNEGTLFCFIVNFVQVHDLVLLSFFLMLIIFCSVVSKRLTSMCGYSFAVLAVEMLFTK